MFSKSFCPYCIKTKELLKSKKIAFTVVEVDEKWTSDDINRLKRESKHKSFPNVFVGEHLVGGNDMLHRIERSGELYKMLDKQGIKYEK